jgi:hypothetical protein
MWVYWGKDGENCYDRPDLTQEVVLWMLVSVYQEEILHVETNTERDIFHRDIARGQRL